MDKVNTYAENRRCLQCGSPIADQTHKAQKFCSKELYSDGTTKCCRERFWSEQRRGSNEVFKNMKMYHESCSESLHQLYNLNFPELSVDHLTDMGIDLSKCAGHRVVDSEQQFFYLGYYVAVNTQTNHTQIYPHHENLF